MSQGYRHELAENVIGEKVREAEQRASEYWSGLMSVQETPPVSFPLDKLGKTLPMQIFILFNPAWESFVTASAGRLTGDTIDSDGIYTFIPNANRDGYIVRKMV